MRVDNIHTLYEIAFKPGNSITCKNTMILAKLHDFQKMTIRDAKDSWAVDELLYIILSEAVEPT